MNWARTQRVATSLFALSGAGALGWAIAQLIFRTFEDKVPAPGSYDVGTMLAICGFVLLFVKDLLLALLKTWNYIWDGDQASHPKTGEAIVWLTEAIVAAAILTVVFDAPEIECPRDWTTCVERADGLNPSCFLTCIRDREVDHLTAQVTQAKNELKFRFDPVDAGLVSLARRLATLRNSLAGSEGRIADAVSNKLLAAGCTLTGTDECPKTPCPPSTGDDCHDPPPPTNEVRSRYTLFYENARLDADGKVTGASFGVKLERPHLHRLELLTRALQPCHQTDVPVEFEVNGYSSTAEFRFLPSGGTVPYSTDLNLETANLRGQIVGAYLKEEGFVVHWEPWSSEADIQRPHQGEESQALNRTVFIDIKSAGKCDLTRRSRQPVPRLPVPERSQ